MKSNPKDYNIFNDVPPFDISKYLPNKTTSELQKMPRYDIPKISGYTSGNHSQHYTIYNTTTKTAQAYNGYQWIDTDERTVCSMHDYSKLYDQHRAPIYKAQEILSQAKLIKQGEFHYLWKDAATQTEPDSFLLEKSIYAKQKEESILKETLTPQEISDEYMQEFNNKLLIKSELAPAIQIEEKKDNFPDKPKEIINVVNNPEVFKVEIAGNNPNINMDELD